MNQEEMEVHRNGAWATLQEHSARRENSPLTVYELPKIEVVEVPVEQGFANSIPEGGGW